MTAGPTLAVRAARAWDPVRGRIEGPVTVACDPATGLVTGVDRHQPPGDGTATLDCGEATVLPGLVDCHVHLCLDPGADPVAHCRDRTDGELLEFARRAAGRALAAGITTLRDLGDRRWVTFGLRTEADGPELVLAGPPLTPAGGHCWFLGGEATRHDELVAAVDERARRGAGVVKVMATGGLLTPGWGMHESQYGREDLEVVVSRARAHGLPVTAHAHGPTGIADAVESGCDGVEHCTFVTADSVACDWQTVDRLAQREVVVSATEAWLPSGDPLPPAAASRVERVWANFVGMHRRGVRLALSSDAGIHPRKPHDVLPHAAVLFAGLGLANADVLAAVTAVPAAACGLGHRKGRVARGFDADLLVVDGDPLTDVGALLRPRAVVRAGRLMTGAS